MSVSIDVVIPSFRLNENNLLPILQQRTAADARISFFLVIDNPDADIPASILNMEGNGTVFLLRNFQNSGASFSRNRGIDAGTAEWILFLDDDLTISPDLLTVYENAATKFPGEIGFIGLVELPLALSDFSKAIAVSGSMDIFNIASRKPSFVWAATANVMVRRNALNGVRFSLKYPKSGGGEDVDFFLSVREKNQDKEYLSLPDAKVWHPWWNDGKPDYKKPWRYGLGNSLLPELNPTYSYRDLLNTPEVIFISLLAGFLLVIFNPALVTTCFYFMLGILVIEFLASGIQTIRRNPASNGKVVFYVFVLRIIYEAGLLWGNISRGRIKGIGERFHDDGKRNKFFFYRTNTHRIVKWILYPVLIYFLIRRSN